MAKRRENFKAAAQRRLEAQVLEWTRMADEMGLPFDLNMRFRADLLNGEMSFEYADAQLPKLLAFYSRNMADRPNA